MKQAFVSMLGALLILMCTTSEAATKHSIATNKPSAAKVGIVGMASFYAKKFHGRFTASGQRYDNNGFTAAHGRLPFGTKLKVTNLRNKRSVVVTVNDRGGFHAYGRIIDLSRAAAKELGMISRGTAKVKLEILK
ncbi:septal ring lytic transglycosylase RlpA family protein [Thiothrix eikelboomii]|uniref:Endolytic peptidoglycan transglycosylase RlpA n=1 Tax=Thiothrix eikelboomii TaxID=92487 RepID=A0A1T4XE48_9GAMM|nr:septal ring lytic transglycosylase RlpA family protein [Thiothrix eikelboomii]SKA87820.1 rare lipoprotein A [Thiothrix eikelboomii]